LSELGLAFSHLSARAERTLAIARQLLKRPSMRRILQLLLQRNLLLAALGEEELAAIIAHCAGLNDTTARRRALTARTWMAWLLKNSRPV
ncbi:MAG TPA: hypothetical protein VNT26_13120, partial [Candidatus Sulfotelmatobacter sp.]|nr:hypothetical protein [Candidatus Sulfotelmatobacter sp.]